MKDIFIRNLYFLWGNVFLSVQNHIITIHYGQWFLQSYGNFERKVWTAWDQKNKRREEKMVRRDDEMQYFCGKVYESQKECEMMPLFTL